MALDIAISSEYYKYKDQNGVVHFTDDLSEVPKNQRENITSFESLKSNTDYSSLNKEVTDSSDNPAGEKSVSDDKLSATFIALQEERTQLEHTFENLQERRAALAEESIRNKTSEEITAYKEQVQQFNTDIQQYEEQYRQFTEKVKLYNNNIKKTNSSKAEDKVE